MRGRLLRNSLLRREPGFQRAKLGQCHVGGADIVPWRDADGFEVEGDIGTEFHRLELPAPLVAVLLAHRKGDDHQDLSVQL